MPGMYLATNTCLLFSCLFVSNVYIFKNSRNRMYTEILYNINIKYKKNNLKRNN